MSATGSGMAFRDWLTSDGVPMPLYNWFSAAGDKFIEHGHRLLGMAAGILTIVLVVVCLRCERRRWVKIYSLALLGGVIAQGVLGGLRVLVDERFLALVHGCTGPLFFAAAAGMVVVTSSLWSNAERDDSASARKLARLALLTSGIAYLQLVLGAIVRHSPHMLHEGAATLFRVAVYFHLLLAAAVAVHVLWLAGRCLKQRFLIGSAITLIGLLVVQLLLGASSWVVKYGMPSWATQIIGETGHSNRAADVASAAILAAHSACGALLVALTVSVALHAARRCWRGASFRLAPVARLAGGPA